MKTKYLTTLFVLGIFICMLDTTIMNVSLPNISEHLHVGLDELSWALNVYLILFAALTIPLTRLAEVLGSHRWFLIGVALFGTGSVISACAFGLNVLLVGRAIQSIGAALVFPLSMTLGISLVPVSRRTGMIAILGITQGISAALGPTVGGVVTQFLGWRWIFLINVPLTVIMIVLGLANLKIKNEVQHRQPLDVLGAVFSIVFLSTLSLGMMQGRVWGWYSWLTISCFAISVITFICFLVTERRSSNPMVPLELFNNRTFTIASLIIVLSNLFLAATTVILPNYFINIQGYDDLRASLLIAPISFAIFVVSPISGFARDHIRSSWLLMMGFAFMAAGFAWLAYGALAYQWSAMVAGLIVGIGYGLITGPILVIAAGSFQDKLLTASQSVTGVLRQVGTMLSVAIFVTGLYVNLDVARKQSADYAYQKIEKTQMPEPQKKVVIQKIDKNMNKSQFEPTNTKKLPEALANSVSDIEQHVVVGLRHGFEKLYIFSLPFILLGVVVSAFLKDKKF